MHPIAKNIYDHPEKWAVNHYTTFNQESGLNIWHSNGVFFIGPYHASTYFRASLVGKFQISRAIKWLINKKLEGLLKKVVE